MRPAGLTAVCVISLILGILGGLALGGGCITTFAQPYVMKVSEAFQEWVLRMQPPQMHKQFAQQRAQQKVMMEETMAVQRPWRPYLIAGLAILTAAVVGLCVGSVKCLRLKPRAHTWLIVGMSAGILHALISSYVGYGIARDTQPIAIKYVNQMQQTIPGPGAPAARAASSAAMQISAVVTMVLVFGWALVKCGFYGIGVCYLLTPRIRRLFEGDGSERAVIDALSETPT
jgi:hypothetical protein